MSTADTAATVSRHIDAVISGNVETVLKNFSDDAVIFTPDGMVRGLAAIRRETEAFFANTPPEMLRALEILRLDADGNVAYLLWKAEPFVALAAESFVVHDGKIATQTFAILGGQTGVG